MMDWKRKTSNVVDGLTHEAANVMVNLNRKIFNVVDKLAQGGTSVMVDWNRKTFSIVNGPAHEIASVMVYVCALKIKEVIPFSLEKKDHMHLTRKPTWRRN